MAGKSHDCPAIFISFGVDYLRPLTLVAGLIPGNSAAGRRRAVWCEPRSRCFKARPGTGSHLVGGAQAEQAEGVAQYLLDGGARRELRAPHRFVVVEHPARDVAIAVL